MNRTVQTGGPSLLPVLLLLLLVLLTALPACSSSDEGDPQAIFADAIPAMKALQTFGFTYEVDRPEDAAPVQGTDVAAIEGAVNAEGGMKASIDILQSGIPLRIDFVALDDTHYVQNPLTGQWQSVPAEDSPVGALNLGAGAIQILEKVQSPAYEGREDVDEVECHRISGTVAAQDVEGIAQGVSVDRTFPVEVWVGVQDSLVRRIVLSGGATDSEPEATVRTIELGSFDKPVVIEAPE